MKVFLAVLAAALFGLVVVTGASLYLSHSTVIFRYKDNAAVDPADELFVLFNPFRSREPEVVAESLLNQLKQGHCDAALTTLPEERSSYICERERDHKLTGWTLVDRSDEPGTTTLHFKAYRADSSVYGNTWIVLSKQANGWQVSGIESWY